jgi:hypothetical protein
MWIMVFEGLAHEDHIPCGYDICGSGSEKVWHMRIMVFEGLALVEQGL